MTYYDKTLKKYNIDVLICHQGTVADKISNDLCYLNYSHEKLDLFDFSISNIENINKLIIQYLKSNEQIIFFTSGKSIEAFLYSLFNVNTINNLVYNIHDDFKNLREPILSEEVTNINNYLVFKNNLIDKKILNIIDLFIKYFKKIFNHKVYYSFAGTSSLERFKQLLNDIFANKLFYVFNKLGYDPIVFKENIDILSIIGLSKKIKLLIPNNGIGFDALISSIDKNILTNTKEAIIISSDKGRNDYIQEFSKIGIVAKQYIVCNKKINLLNYERLKEYLLNYHINIILLGDISSYNLYKDACKELNIIPETKILLPYSKKSNELQINNSFTYYNMDRDSILNIIKNIL